MEQSVEQCRGKRCVGEDVAPLAEALITGDRGAPFIWLTEQLEEPCGGNLVEFSVP
jgi:hypothetical protein